MMVNLFGQNYMEKEEAVNILQFWLAADNFQAQLAAKSGQYDGQEAQNDAMILYDNQCNLTRTNAPWYPDPLVYLPGFLSSNLYYKYLNDLIHSVRNDEFSGAYTPFLGHGPNSPHEHEPSIGLSDGSVAQ
eukprot:g39274.t1